MTDRDAARRRWLDAQKRRLDRVELAPSAHPIGRIERIADGVASISGLPDAALGELLSFEGGRFGFVLALDETRLSAVLLDESEAIEAGSEVRALGEAASVPIGPALLGRIVDPLGRPLDGGEPIVAEARAPIERPAPAIIDRDLVCEPIETGILVIDALFAIGKGQRELIIGDRGSGKTSIAIDALCNQKRSEAVSIYVAIGQRASEVERAIAAVRAHGAFERSVFVVAPASAPAGLQWLAPFTGFSIAEGFRDAGGDALIAIDDLTKHAATHRELALLTREPPGREAYPGDVFYLHARLLERAAKMAPERGGGSITALPIAQTDAGALSAYIPTNLISITDGQIVTSLRLLALDQRPAVDVGLSVSRVGGKAQAQALRAEAGRLRLEYAQFLELEMFTRFGGLSDSRVKAQIERGRRIRALLTQPRFESLRTIDQIALLAGLNDGALDPLEPAEIGTLRERLPGRLDDGAPEIGAAFEADGSFDADARARLVEQVRALARELAAARGR